MNFGNINLLWVNLLVLPSTSPWTYNQEPMQEPFRIPTGKGPYGPLSVWAFYVDDTAFVLNVFYKK